MPLGRANNAALLRLNARRGRAAAHAPIAIADQGLTATLAVLVDTVRLPGDKGG